MNKPGGMIMSLVSGVDSYAQFPEQQQALDMISSGMVRLAAELAARHPDATMQVMFRTSIADINRRREEARRALADPANFDRYEAELAAHGLTAGTTEWNLKITGLTRTSEQFSVTSPEPEWEDTYQDAGDDPPPDDEDEPADHETAEKKGRRRLRLPGKKSLARLFTKWANILLGSLGFVPGVTALEELKKALEAGLDEL